MIEPNPDGSDTLVVLRSGEMLAVMRELPHGNALDFVFGNKWAAIRWPGGCPKPESVRIVERIRETG